MGAMQVLQWAATYPERKVYYEYSRFIETPVQNIAFDEGEDNNPLLIQLAK